VRAHAPAVWGHGRRALLAPCEEVNAFDPTRARHPHATPTGCCS
jgi:hypothetical protein